MTEIRRYELSLKFNATRCEDYRDLLNHEVAHGRWQDLYRRPYITFYIDNPNNNSHTKRGITVCITDRQDVEDNMAALIFKQLLP